MVGISCKGAVQNAQKSQAMEELDQQRKQYIKEQRTLKARITELEQQVEEMSSTLERGLQESADQQRTEEWKCM